MVATLVLEASALKACQFESDPEHHIKAHFSRSPVMDSHCLVQYPKCVSIWFPVTTFLKVACGDENCPGGR